MLPENANPDLPEKQEEEVTQVETENPTPENQESTPEQTETPVTEEQNPAEEENTPESATPSEEAAPEEQEAQETVAETPTPESEAPESKEEETPVPEPEVSSAEESAVETPAEGTEETPAEETEEEASDEDDNAPIATIELPPLNQELLPKIEELVKDREKRGQILVDATISDLLQLMEGYAKEEKVSNFISRVGLIKRSYDARKYQENPPKEIQDRFHYALAQFNKKRNAHQASAEGEKRGNSKRKKELLQKLQEVVSAEDPNRIQEVRDIQEEWKGIGHVLREDIEPLYKAYRHQLDKFYKLREMHFELLDYDRKINLQEKEKLIKEAENLIPAEEDREKLEVWKEKMDMLAELRQQWKAIGHVPREDMERINNEYRAVVDRFFEVRQGFMEIQDQLRSEFGEKKQAILTQMEAFKTFHSEKPRDWNDATRTLREHQEAWNGLGQAPQSINGELWSKYRDICNSFFSKKSEFFKKLDGIRAENLAKKRELVEKVEAIKDSTEIEKTANEIKKLQREWKSIGPVPERHSNKIWNRFRSACDEFFAKRREKYQSQSSDEKGNLEAKKALVEEVNKLEVDENNINASIDQIKALQAKWKTIGKVPYKEKDKIWEEFRGAIDAFFDGLSLKRGELRELKLKTSIENISNDDDRNRSGRGKIARLRRKIAQSQEKVDQYSINVQYIAKGKSGDTLRKRIEDDIEKEKKMIAEWKNQIKVLNEAMKKPKPVAEAPAAEAKVEESAPAAEESPAPEAEAAEQADAPAESATEAEASPEAPAEEAKAEETPAEEASSEEAPKAEEEAPTEEVKAEETPAEEAASEETPKAEEEAPAEEAKAEDAPAEDKE